MRDSKLMFGSRLALRLTTLLLILSFVVLVGMSRFVVHNIRSTSIEKQGQQQERLAQHISQSAATINYQAAINLAQAWFSDDSQSAFITDSKGVYLAHSQPALVGRSSSGDLSSSTLSIMSSQASGYVQDTKSEQVIGYSTDSNGNTIAAAYSLKSIDTFTQSLSAALFFQFAVSMLIISSVGGGVIWFIVGLPLHQFTIAAEKLSQEELHTRIETHTMDDEFGVLAATFNHMASQLETHFSNLENVLELGKNVTHVMDFDESIRNIHDCIQKGLGFDHVKLYLHNSVTQTLKLVADTYQSSEEMVAEHSEPIPVAEMPIFQEVVGSQLGARLPKNDATGQMSKYGIGLQEAGKQVIASAWAEEKPVAIIQADNLVSKRDITTEQVEALRIFAGYAGLAIVNAQLHSELEQRVRERTKQLEAANKELESFSYSVSHDLRAPLRTIRGYINMLAREHGNEISEEGQACISNISGAAERMGQLIDDLLAFSRLSWQTVHLRLVEPSEIVKEVLKELQDEADGKHEVIVKPLLACHADPLLLRQVFTNLIGNAIKYSRNQPAPSIEIGSMQSNGKKVFYVKDNGVGFDMRYADKLFGVFQRLHSDTEFEGTGVGLAIVQRIVTRHNGAIWAEAEPGRGATFFFTIEK